MSGLILLLPQYAFLASTGTDLLYLLTEEKKMVSFQSYTTHNFF